MTWQLHPGDCLDPATGLVTLEAQSVDHVITDPPYEAEAHSKGRRINHSPDRGGAIWKRSGVTCFETKAISYPPITEEERRAVAVQIVRVTRRWILTFCQSEAAHLWRAAYEAAGARYIRTGVFWKTDAQPQYSGDRPGVGWEAIVICHAAEGRTRWNGGGRCARWQASTDARFGRSLYVDGQKPLVLMESLIRDFTDAGELICDPYAGAGTTLVAAVKLGRCSVGWEKDPETYAKAEKRLEGAREQLTLGGC